MLKNIILMKIFLISLFSYSQEINKDIHYGIYNLNGLYHTPNEICINSKNGDKIKNIEIVNNN